MADNDGNNNDGGQGQGDGQGDGQGQGDGDLGPAGKAALDVERNLRRAAQREAAQFKTRIEALEAAGLSEQEQAVKAARTEAAGETWSKAKTAILRYAVQAVAGGKLADPEDATRFLDVSSFEVDDEGNLDVKAVGSAIDALLKSKPYLAAGATPRPTGSGDGGPRGSAPKAGDDFNSMIRRGAGRV